MKYICGECGRTFDEPIKSREQIGEFWGTPAYSDFYTCPYCGSEAVDEAGECPVCGEPIQSEIDFCDGCRNFVNKAVSDFIKQVQDYLRTDRKTALELILNDLEGR